MACVQQQCERVPPFVPRHQQYRSGHVVHGRVVFRGKGGVLDRAWVHACAGQVQPQRHRNPVRQYGSTLSSLRVPHTQAAIRRKPLSLFCLFCFVCCYSMWRVLLLLLLRLRPAGSIEEEEDQQRVRAFLSRHPDFELEPPGMGEGAAAARRSRSRPLVPPEVVTPEGFVVTLPHVHDTDGAFAARLRRR
jgi:hypothetical protein